MDLYVAAGAKYFTALANHHDNFDNYNSSFHNWNSVNIGPKKDIVGIYGKLARAARPALRGHQPCLARLALAADGLRVRSRRPAGRRSLRRLQPDQGRRQGQVVGGLRSAGTLHRAATW